MRWDFACVHCNKCTYTGPPKRLGNVQLIPYVYPKGLQQNKRRESNLCPSASTGSQVQLTTPRLTPPDKKLLSSRYDPPYQANAKNTIKNMSIQITFCARAVTNWYMIWTKRLKTLMSQKRLFHCATFSYAEFPT